ncbi:uncharacterized protein N7496_004715 [Penicillium cataractarum]|uniref:AMP-dependent synthetase/ligase domain-containing protein n=1 Tax=Penicillium cataractarum TaxID=2100454 RepID=A0A9W9VFB8_9EURO|nr:uncharacterized protein N7496_004715 [Penicillium cataractarum]KAJ5377306.1 hypothetical protein N7496_004715 [Penicillium cataractarum]
MDLPSKMATIPTELPSEPITDNDQPSAYTTTSTGSIANSAPPMAIPPEPFLIDLFCNLIEDPAVILIREWCVEGGVVGSWSIAEFLRDVCLVSRCIWLELGVEERRRLKTEGEDVFFAVVSGGCYAFAVLVVAIYGIGGVIVPISPRVHPEEAKYFLETCNASLICAVPSTANRVQNIIKAMNTNIPIFTYTPHKADTSPSDIKFYLSDSPPPPPTVPPKDSPSSIHPEQPVLQKASSTTAAARLAAF